MNPLSAGGGMGEVIPVLGFLAGESAGHRAQVKANKDRAAAAVAQDKANAAQLQDNAAKYATIYKVAAIMAVAFAVYAIFGRK